MTAYMFLGEQWSFHPCWLGYIGDAILPSYKYYYGINIFHKPRHYEKIQGGMFRVFFGDEILPSYVGITVNHDYRDPY